MIYDLVMEFCAPGAGTLGWYLLKITISQFLLSTEDSNYILGATFSRQKLYSCSLSTEDSIYMFGWYLSEDNNFYDLAICKIDFNKHDK